MNVLRTGSFLILLAFTAAVPARAQELPQGVDLTSPAMTEAELTREEVASRLDAASRESPADFTGVRLSGLGSGRDATSGARCCGRPG